MEHWRGVKKGKRATKRERNEKTQDSQYAETGKWGRVEKGWKGQGSRE